MAEQFGFSPKNPFFVGRESELLRISDLIESGQRQLIITITGPNGIGKSALAREALERAPDDFIKVWIPFSDERIRSEMMRRLVQSHETGRRHEKALVVLDGVAAEPAVDVQVLVSVLSQLESVHAIIVTGGNFLAVGGGDMPLSPLTPDQARRFLRLSTASILPETLAVDIIMRARGYPAALQALARLVESSLMLPNIDGQLYEIKRAEESQIIQAVLPEIITFSGELVYHLRKAPEMMFDIRSRQFEELIADLFHDRGFDVELTKTTRDGGRDILARLNTGVVKFLCLIEAKKHRKDRPVGVQLVRDLYGTFCDEQANSAMLVTTSYFTKDAKDFTERHKYQLSLKDYTDVVGWLVDYKGNKIR